VEDGCKPADGGWSDTWSTSPVSLASLTDLCPLPSVFDCEGDGGRSGDPGRGEAVPSSDSGVMGDTGEVGEATLPLDAPDLPLAVDFIDPASDLSIAPSTLPSAAPDALGLSVFALPGIFERMPRKDLDDSFVSDLLKEGYDSSRSEGEFRLV
jgi:hypothetical protein